MHKILSSRWVLVAGGCVTIFLVAVIVVIVIAVNSGRDDSGDTSNTSTDNQLVTEKATTEKPTTGTDTKVSGIVHPGALYTDEAFSEMKTMITKSGSVNKSTYEALLAAPFSRDNWGPRAVNTVIRGGDGDNVSRLYIDVARAYQCALIWKLSGKASFGEEACKILNAWSGTLKTVSGNADRYLAAGLFGYQLANISEMMRDHPSFKVAQMQDMLYTVFYKPLNERFLTGNTEYGDDHNGAYIQNYWANWDLCNLASMMAIGIFCDKKEVFDKGVDYFRYGFGNGSIYNAVPYVYEDGTAQWQESGRDQGHSTLGIGLMGCVCEMAWNQGVDLYSYASNRFLKAAEYVARYNNGENVQFSTYEWGNGQNGAVQTQTVVSDVGRNDSRPIWYSIYNHYANRKDLKADNIWARIQLYSGVEYGAVSGGHATTYDQPGWGSITYAGIKGNTSATEPKPFLAEGRYRIVSNHSKKAICVRGNSVGQASVSNDSSQLYDIIYLGGGEYQIKNVATGLSLMISGDIYSSGNVISVGTYDGTLKYRYSIIPNDIVNKSLSDCRIVVSSSGKNIDIKDFSTADDAKLIQWRCCIDDSKGYTAFNQRWTFQKV